MFSYFTLRISPYGNQKVATTFNCCFAFYNTHDFVFFGSLQSMNKNDAPKVKITPNY